MACPWPNPIQHRLEELATCLCAQIISDGLPPVCFCGVLPGAAVAFDYGGPCTDSCGMAWVRLVSFYPSTVLGQPSAEPGNCDKMTGIDIELGIARCASVMDEDGTPPSAETLLAEFELQMADAYAMRRAVLCCMDSRDFLQGTYDPFGPEGGMVGGTLQVSTQVGSGRPWLIPPPVEPIV